MKHQDEHQRLKQLAENMLRQSQSRQSDRIHSATGFATSNISILHQQFRCTNLAWALAHTGRIADGSVIGIVGASFSGLMLACALAKANNVIVYVFEKEDRLLARYRDKGIAS